MKLYKRLIALMLISAAIIAACCACSGKTNSAEFFAMDTVIQAEINDKNSARLLKTTEKIINQQEKILSKTIPDSDLARLNSNRKLSTAELSQDTLNIIEAGLEISRETSGCFDMSLGVLSDLWDFANEHPVVPAQSDINDSLKKIGYQNITCTDSDIILANDITLDFGGIAKGYVTDLIIEEYKKNSVNCAMLSLGGNVYVLGDNHGKAWRIGIADPKNPNEVCAVLSLQDKAVVTSGDYQRYFEQDSKRYHHIIDPKTGFPADNDLAGVTVVADKATLADGYSTALFVMGYEKAVSFLSSKKDIGAVFVKKDGEVICTDNIKGALEKR